jgi:hypothetical protein
LRIKVRNDAVLKNRLVLVLLAVCLAALVLAGCAAEPPPPPTGSPTQPPPPTATFTPFPTETPRATRPPSATPTSTTTPAPTPTPDQDLEAVTLIGLAWEDRYELMLGFQFPGPVEADQYRVTLEGKEYRCDSPAIYPDRLYCRGQGARVLSTANIRVYEQGQAVPGFEKRVWVPYFSNDYNDYPWWW